MVRFAPVTLRESQVLRLQRLYPKSLYKEGIRSMLVPKPMTARVGGKPLRDLAVLDWAATVLRSVLIDPIDVRKDAAVGPDHCAGQPPRPSPEARWCSAAAEGSAAPTSPPA